MTNILSQKEINKIKNTCGQYGIYKYTINNDGSVDVDGDVSIKYTKNGVLPLKFNIVTGFFSAFKCDLKTLEGAPKEVGKSFDCSGNDLSSLEGAPKKVGWSFLCKNNDLTSLDFLPESIGMNLDFSGNNLTSLVGCPEKVNGDLNVSYNKLESLEYCASEVSGDFSCFKCGLKSLKYVPHIVGGVFNVANNYLTTLQYCPPGADGYILGQNKLTSFEGLPSTMPRIFRCQDNNIRTLEGCPMLSSNDYSFIDNFFPMTVMALLLDIRNNQDRINIFLKYHDHFEVWKDGVFNEAAFNELIEEIHDGLE